MWRALNNNGYDQKNEPTICLPSRVHTKPKPKTNPNPKLSFFREKYCSFFWPYPLFSASQSPEGMLIWIHRSTTRKMTETLSSSQSYYEFKHWRYTFKLPNAVCKGRLGAWKEFTDKQRQLPQTAKDRVVYVCMWKSLWSIERVLFPWSHNIQQLAVAIVGSQWTNGFVCLSCAFVIHRCAASYQDNNAKKPIALVGSGQDGLSGILPVLQSDNVVYALLRVVSCCCEAFWGEWGVWGGGLEREGGGCGEREGGEGECLYP